MSLLKTNEMQKNFSKCQKMLKNFFYDFRYKPIGFSITSMESCSPNVLKDAVEATETAMTTLLSVIGT